MELKALDKASQKKAATTRHFIVKAMEFAHSKAANHQNCAAGFAKAGLYPFNPLKALNSGYALPAEPGAAPEAYQDPYGGFDVLTSAEALEFLAQKEYGCGAAEAAEKFGGDPYQLYRIMRSESKFASGCLLSPIPDLFVRNQVNIVDSDGELVQRVVIERVNWERGPA
jgi:hypothetical protein